jgi:flagellar basal-body rod modification protein FlgD
VIDGINPLTVSSPATRKASQEAAEQANRATGAGVTAGTSGLGRDAFLQLLVTQLGHQNPLKPQEDGEFIAQLAQFSSLEQLTSIQETLSQVASALGVVNLKSAKP